MGDEGDGVRDERDGVGDDGNGVALLVAAESAAGGVTRSGAPTGAGFPPHAAIPSSTDSRTSMVKSRSLISFCSIHICLQIQPYDERGQRNLAPIIVVKSFQIARTPYLTFGPVSRIKLPAPAGRFGNIRP